MTTFLHILISMCLGVALTVASNYITVPLCYWLIWKNGIERESRMWIYQAWFFGNIILFLATTTYLYLNLFTSTL